jgi:hypothetical protein
MLLGRVVWPALQAVRTTHQQRAIGTLAAPACGTMEPACVLMRRAVAYCVCTAAVAGDVLHGQVIMLHLRALSRLEVPTPSGIRVMTYDVSTWVETPRPTSNTGSVWSSTCVKLDD